MPDCEATAVQERSAKKSGKVSSSEKSIWVEVDLCDGRAVVVDDDLGWSGERFVLVRFADGHQRYLRADELTILK